MRAASLSVVLSLALTRHHSTVTTGGPDPKNLGTTGVGVIWVGEGGFQHLNEVCVRFA